MNQYDVLYIIVPDLDEEATRASVDKFKGIVESNGGEVVTVDEWGKRKLAYEINDLTDGDYTLINFHADPTQIAELDRVLRITDAVVRHMIVRRDDQE